MRSVTEHHSLSDYKSAGAECAQLTKWKILPTCQKTKAHRVCHNSLGKAMKEKNKTLVKMIQQAGRVQVNVLQKMISSMTNKRLNRFIEAGRIG
jgi:phosphoribosylcarboxyaminoimidazole (NCAIR) mutase